MKMTYMTKEQNFISIIVHIRNDEKYITDFIKNVDDLFADKFEAYEFVLINNNSVDASADRIRQIQNEINGDIILITLPWTHDIEVAMFAGVDIAIGDFVFEFDTTVIDFELKEILNVYYKCMEGYDIVAASSGKNMNIGARLFYRYLNKVSYKKMDLQSESFRIVSRRAINRALNSKQKTKYRKALYHYSGLGSTNITYNPISTDNRKAKTSFWGRLALAVNILIGFSNIGTRISFLFSIIFLLLSMLAACYTIYSFITFEGIEPGWTTTMLFLSGSFSGIFLILALLSKYMVVILYEVQNNPDYTFQSVERLSNK